MLYIHWLCRQNIVQMCVMVDIKHSYDVLISGFLLGSLNFDWL